jgi:hypothetical protein
MTWSVLDENQGVNASRDTYLRQISKPVYHLMFEQSELKFGFQAESWAHVTFVFARRMLSQLSPSLISYVAQGGARQRFSPTLRGSRQKMSRTLMSSSAKVATPCEWETV